jgi:arylsulfatase A-like enzyme
MGHFNTTYHSNSFFRKQRKAGFLKGAWQLHDFFKTAVFFIFFGATIFTTGCKDIEPKTERSNKPNIVLINLDDMGYGDLTLTGATDYKTPHLDKMASDGVVFTHFYTPQAVCSSSRAGLLTGCYPNRVGFHGALDHMATTGINPEETPIAERRKDEGYVTASYGKWHLGHNKKRPGPTLFYKRFHTTHNRLYSE